MQSIVSLTRADDPARFVAAIKGRVAALARAHTLLAEARWAGADLRSLLAKEVEPFRCDGDDGARITLDGPRVALSPGAAQPLAMAVHELATSAAKHGALSKTGGRVLIAWRLEGPEGGLAISWTERGGPPVVPPTHSGFGAAVLDATVQRQLGGTLDMGREPTGLRCIIRVPFKQLQAQLGSWMTR